MDLSNISPTEIVNCMDTLHTFKGLNEQAGFENAYLKGVVGTRAETVFVSIGEHFNFEFI